MTYSLEELDFKSIHIKLSKVKINDVNLYDVYVSIRIGSEDESKNALATFDFPIDAEDDESFIDIEKRALIRAHELVERLAALSINSSEMEKFRL